MDYNHDRIMTVTMKRVFCVSSIYRKTGEAYCCLLHVCHVRRYASRWLAPDA